MTVSTGSATDGSAVREDLVTLSIDGLEVSVPKGTLVIRAAEQVGVSIPRFCDHPLLAPVGACRQCLVEVALPDKEGNPKTMMGPPGRVKPQASCTLVVSEGMVVKTQGSSEVADKAQQGNMEFLLVNHPLDCPVCDKGGECPLQNQAMSNGRGETRFSTTGGVKRTFPKPIAISAQVLLDRERCVLCARCTRFSEQIAGDPFIALIERGALQQVGIYEREPFESYFSGNTIQICPVGALTSASYRFRSRPFDLISTRSVCEHCASGCELRTDHRRGKVTRRLAGNDPDVNEEWNCDKGRFAFLYARQEDRLTTPLVRDDETGKHRPASWPEAFAVAARGLAAARGRVGVLTGGRLTGEDAYAYSKFARVALGTNDIDFRARPHSAEEADFLAAHVVGRALDVTYADLEKARVVVLAGLEPEDESPIVFLRLRKAAGNGTRVVSVAPFTSRGLQKMSGTLVRTAPGDEPAALAALADDGEVALDAGGVILVGERLGTVPGALSAALQLARTTGARLAWVPRRAGERGALETGCLPNLLPGGRPVADAAARVDLGTVWGSTVPQTAGRDGDAIVAAAAAGELAALVVAGVDPVDLPDPAAALAALRRADFVVSLEIRSSAVTAEADVVLPVAPVAEKSGMFVDWEGRVRPFDKVLRDSNALPDLRVLSGIADELGVDLGFKTVEQARTEMSELGAWDGARATMRDDGYLRPRTTGGATSTRALDAAERSAVPTPERGLRVATWKMLIDGGRMLDGEEHLKATARAPVALVSAATLAGLGLHPGQPVTVAGDSGSASYPVGVADLPDGVVWVPTTAEGWVPTAGSVARLTTREGTHA
ncbi:MAG TPA: NADH-quinone oxidoreductase subunit G [Nocardioidaceae bacterium]|nr:NADH-quinone oxidoreductase subunit G [Nocardioidaceae bacterium]